MQGLRRQLGPDVPHHDDRPHESAIEVARTEQADGKNADSVALAKKIEVAQTTEIAQMKDLLNR